MYRYPMSERGIYSATSIVNYLFSIVIGQLHLIVDQFLMVIFLLVGHCFIDG